jgi:hypothetical protein
MRERGVSLIQSEKLEDQCDDNDHANDIEYIVAHTLLSRHARFSRVFASQSECGFVVDVERSMLFEARSPADLLNSGMFGNAFKKLR